MKTRSKFTTSKSTRLIAGSLVAITMFGGLASFKLANAQSLQNEIDQLKQQNTQNKHDVNKLREIATSYQDAINQLEDDIKDKEFEINASTAKQAKLETEIKQAIADLASQKDLLGKNIRAMYVEGDMTTVEMLASSNDLSEYIDKQQYRNSVKNKITETLTKINDLKHQLEAQKKQVEVEIKTQNERRSELASNQAEKTRLLSLNESEQTKFNQDTQKNQEKIKELEATQEALRRRLSSGSLVSQGPIKQGDVVGTVGNTGYSFGAHLHLEARDTSGNLINPNNYLGGSWIRPVEGGFISQGFGVPSSLYVRGYHPGIDFAGVTNQPVRAVADGEIVSRGWSTFGTSAYGYAVVIRHSNGVFSIYGHMNPS